MKAPFPYFGGKSRASDIVWSRLGDVNNYVEPFFGSGAVLLSRPEFSGVETVNDIDCFLANFWRSVAHDPDETAHWADWPVSENDLHARHAYLVSKRDELRSKLEGDPDFYDAKLAGWWVWGICAWIGGGWCSGNGPWQVSCGKLVDNRQIPHLGSAGQGINRKIPHLGSAGQGINRKRPHLGDAGRGINRKRPHLGGAGQGQGINRRIPHLGDAECASRYEYIFGMFQALYDRLRDVRVCCGDWARLTGTSVTTIHSGVTGVFLDPPYSDKAGRCCNLYACDSLSVAHDVREWCLANSDDDRMRIALCGYEGEHNMPDTWTCIPWKAHGGYGLRGISSGRANLARERIWFSPSCLNVDHLE